MGLCCGLPDHLSTDQGPWFPGACQFLEECLETSVRAKESKTRAGRS